MAELNFNFNLKGLDGQDIIENKEPINAGKALANELARETTGDSLKHYEWGKTLYKGEPLNLDISDTNTLETFVKNCPRLFNICKAQLLEVFIVKK